jgi:hypothetical protein
MECALAKKLMGMIVEFKVRGGGRRGGTLPWEGGIPYKPRFTYNIIQSSAMPVPIESGWG